MALSKSSISQKSNQPAKINIQRCALLLFAEKGFEGARTREIAEAAGVNHALIKYHFGNKELLWQASVDFLFQGLDEAMSDFLDRAEQLVDPAQRFRLFVELYVRYCAEHPEHARIMAQESTSDNPRLQWAVREHLMDTRHTMDELFTDLFAAGLLPRMSLISLRYMLTAACQNVFTLATEIKHLYGVDAMHEAQVKAHTEAVVKLFLR